jgi:hypothetical protein
VLSGSLHGRLDALSGSWRDDHGTRIAARHERPLDGFGPSMRRESEETPVHGQHYRTAHASIGLHGLFGAEVPIRPRLAPNSKHFRAGARTVPLGWGMTYSVASKASTA